ncbi:rhodanese-like domain-containing protein [bacterium]|nr:rhodanese-like domain-containing protein [bacterium]
MDEQLKKYRYDSDKAEKFFTKIMAYTLGPVELKEIMEEDNVKILDVRDYQDFSEGHIPTAISMPRAKMDERLDELSKECLYIVYCYNQQCHLAMCACRFLASKGYHCMHLDGGYRTWSKDFQFVTTKE